MCGFCKGIIEDCPFCTGEVELEPEYDPHYWDVD